MIQLDDLDDDGVGDLGVLHTVKSSLTARMRIRNPVTPKNIINTPVVGGDGNIPPIAMAGMDQAVTAGFAVTLDGGDSFDPDGNRLTYVWRQVSGPDVTDGQGKFDGRRTIFAAPREVRSVVMKLIVTDVDGLTGSVLVVVNALEDAERAFFVDRDSGSDSTGDGSKDNPFQTILTALGSISDRQDIYVMNPRSGSYTPAQTLNVPNGTSLYGGYDKRWIRDRVANKTRVVSSHPNAVSFSDVEQDAWFDGFDLTGGNAPSSSGSGRNTAGVVVAEGGARMHILSNSIRAGNAGASTTSGGGTSYGVYVYNIDSVQVIGNRINSGFGGSGASPAAASDSAGGGGNGSNGSGTTGGGGGSGGGGRGGNAGTGFGESGDGGTDGSGGSGGDGGAGGPGSGSTGATDADGGPGGRGGNGGNGGNGFGTFDNRGVFVPQPGANGGSGNPGLGGGGGGGGRANGNGVNGGGGGGGGGGGRGGAGGAGGHGGGASIAVVVAMVRDAEIYENELVSATGGRGGTGARGQDGGNGGKGGTGAAANSSSVFGTGGEGAEGGGGGKGGRGGTGGGGGGGPSYGFVVGPGSTADIRDNRITNGAGGSPGSGSSGGFGGVSGGNGTSVGGAGATGLTSALSLRGANGTPSQAGNNAPVFRVEE
jgi:hypothetical protein